MTPGSIAANVSGARRALIAEAAAAPRVEASQVPLVASRKVSADRDAFTKDGLAQGTPPAPKPPEPAWALNFSVTALADKLRAYVNLPKGTTKALSIWDADNTLLETRLPIYLADKVTGELMRHPATGELLALNLKDGKWAEEFEELKRAYPNAPWDAHRLDFRENGSAEWMARTPVIDSQIERMRRACSRAGTLVLSARNSNGAGVLLERKLQPYELSHCGVITPNEDAVAATLGLSDVRYPSERKALVIAALIELVGPSVRHVEFIDDGDHNLMAAMEYLPSRYPSISFAFYDVVHVGNHKYERRLAGRSRDGHLVNNRGQPMTLADVKAYRGEDAPFPEAIPLLAE